MRAIRPNIFILLFSLSIAASGCTRHPYDPAEPASFNRGRFVVRKILPATVVRAVSAAGNTAGVLGVAVMTGSGEVILLTDEEGTWAERGRITATSSASRPVCDIAPGSGSFWNLLVSDDAAGMVLHHTDGMAQEKVVIPTYREYEWDDERGCLETSLTGEISVVLQAYGRGPYLCLLAGEEWVHHEIPNSSWYAEILGYTRDSVDRHHVLFQQTSIACSCYSCFIDGSWTRTETVENGPQLSHAGAPVRLSLSAPGTVRVIGFDLYRNVLVMWEDVDNPMEWDAEGLPIAEDVLLNRYLTVTTAHDGTPYVAVARFNGATRYDLLWLSRRSTSWNVDLLAAGLHRYSTHNPIHLMDMAATGDTPHLIFAELDPVDELMTLWEAVPR